MQMRNWLVSTVLGLGLMGGAACGPASQEPPAPDSTPAESAPPQAPEAEEGTVSAMAVRTITWADLEKTKLSYGGTCVTGYYVHSCSFCASNLFLYAQEYNAGGCTSADDFTHSCYTCDKQLVQYTERVALPDGDIIDVTVEHGVTAADGVEFRLESGSNVTWWKQVTIIGGGETWRVWNEGGRSWCDWPYPTTSNCNTNSQWAAIVADPGTRFVFSKAKGIFAVHTDMYNLYNLSERLTGGDRVTFRWVKD